MRPLKWQEMSVSTNKLSCFFVEHARHHLLVTQHHYLPVEDPDPPRRIQRTSKWDNNHGDHTMGGLAMGALQVDLMVPRTQQLSLAIKGVTAPLHCGGPTGIPSNTMQSQAPSYMSVRFSFAITTYL